MLIERRWVHIAFEEVSQFTETYGFVGSSGTVNLEGVLIQPVQKCSDSVFIMMHPSSTLQLLPLPTAMAEAGNAVLCMGSRYAKNDAPLIYEKVLLDLGATVRYAKEVLGFKKVVLLGWSGGGSLALFYQSQAEHPSITATPAGDLVNLKAAGLVPADGLVLQAAHRSRARTLCDWLDPSVTDEANPDIRSKKFDLYSPESGPTPPYPEDWLKEYRAAQHLRMRGITERVRETLHMLQKRGGHEIERGFVTHRTMAEPRFLDGSIEPNDRPIGRCYLGLPETVNSGPVGLARFSTLRSWLSQWSVDDSQADGVRCAAQISIPMLAIEHSADDAVPQPDIGLMYQACASLDKRMEVLQGANHYFKGQPNKLRECVDMVSKWMHAHQW